MIFYQYKNHNSNQILHNRPLGPAAPDRHLRPNTPLLLSWKPPVNEGPRRGRRESRQDKKEGKEMKGGARKKEGPRVRGPRTQRSQGAPAAKPLRQWLPVCAISS